MSPTELNEIAGKLGRRSDRVNIVKLNIGSNFDLYGYHVAKSYKDVIETKCNISMDTHTDNDYE